MSSQDRLLSDEELEANVRMFANDVANILVDYGGLNTEEFFEAERNFINGINTQKRLYAESVQKESDDMARFIAALLIQSGGSVKVTKRTLQEIPVPSSITFERFDNIDGSIEFRLKDELNAKLTSNKSKE